MHIEDFEDQLTIKPPPPGLTKGRYEAKCHLCSWTYYRWTDEDARVFLRNHIISAHLTPYEVDDAPFNPGTGPRTS